MHNRHGPCLQVAPCPPRVSSLRKKTKPLLSDIYLFHLKIYLCIYFWLCWVFVDGGRFSLLAASWGYSLVAMRGLLTAVAPLVAEHRL